MRKIFSALLCGCWAAALPTLGESAPTVVQYSTYQTSDVEGEVLSHAQFNTPTASGNTIWVVVTLSDYAGAHTLNITDTQGNTYTLLNQENDGSPGYQTLAQFYATNIVGDGAVPDTITLSTGFENYRGLLIVEVGGVRASGLIGSSANIQDGLSAGTNAVNSGNIAVTADQAPALLLSVSLNTTGGSSDLGGSGVGGPTAGVGGTQIAQFWNFGGNLATFQSAAISGAGTASAAFNSLDTDSYVTVAAAFASALPPAQAAPTVTISASPTSIIAGSTSTLTWASSNATSCSASGGWAGSEPTAGTLTVAPTVTSTYALSCSGPGGTSNAASATVIVNPPSPSVSFTSNTGSIIVGGSTTLIWSSANATSCVASGAWTGTQATSGTVLVSPSATSTYILTCANSGGQSPAVSTTVAVMPGPAQPPALTFSASSGTVIPGNNASLTWSSTGATSCKASGAWSGPVALAGVLPITPAATSAYTLTCLNANGISIAKSTTVTVAPAKPTVSISAYPSGATANGASTLVWSSANAMSCTASGAWSGLQALAGRSTVSPVESSVYTLTCVGTGGLSAVGSARVSVAQATAPRLLQYAIHQTHGSDFEGNSTVRLNAPSKAGDAIWVVASVSDYAAIQTVSVTDSLGNVYIRLDQKNDEAPGYQSLVHFYASNIAGGAGQPNTITVHWPSDNYKGVLIAEITGVDPEPLVGHSARIQDALAPGSNNVVSGSIALPDTEHPVFVVGLSMNTSGGSSDLGGSGNEGPSVGSRFNGATRCWSWGENLATFETLTSTGDRNAAAVFSAQGKDSYVTVMAAFH